MEVVLEPNIASDPKKKTFLDDPQWPEHNILVDKNWYVHENNLILFAQMAWSWGWANKQV